VNRLITGDCHDILKTIPSNTVDLIVTSPPYANQRRHTYGGIKPSEYVTWFLPISNELRRVLKPTGSFILNIREHSENGERHPYVLQLILALREQGWRWTDEFIWCKTNPVPGRWPNRLANAWERLLHFTKEERFTFYPDQVMVPITSQRNYTNAKDQRIYSRTRSGYSFNRKNFRGRTVKYPTNVLHLPCETSNQHHSAAFPLALPTFFVKLFTQQGDVVLDPFVGSGTTCLAAATLGRHYIGIDQSNDAINVAVLRLTGKTKNLNSCAPKRPARARGTSPYTGSR